VALESGRVGAGIIAGTCPFRKVAGGGFVPNNDPRGSDRSSASPRRVPTVEVTSMRPLPINTPAVRGMVLLAGLLCALTGCNKSSTGGSSDSTGRSGEEVPVSTRKAKSLNNLKQIGMALHEHFSAQNAFPAAAVCDTQGKPLLSWRVAILPYAGEDDLYKQFRLNEPWDSEHNKKLIPKMPKAFLLPTAALLPTPDKGKEADGLTHYRALVSVPSEAGNDVAAFNWVDPKRPGPLRGNGIGHFQDGMSNTLLVAEAADPVVWTKPDELIYHPRKPLPAFGYAWDGQCNVLFADGARRSLDRKISEPTLRALITARAGDIPGNDY
jgi:prepilin-type processing-associated H-X9-DG protein